MASILMVILYIVFFHCVKFEEFLFCIGDWFPENHTLLLFFVFNPERPVSPYFKLLRAIYIPCLDCAGNLLKLFCFSKGYKLPRKLIVEEVFTKVQNYFPKNTKEESDFLLIRSAAPNPDS